MSIRAVTTQPSLSTLDRMQFWIHDHPTTSKVIRISTLIVGIGLLVSLPFAVPILSTGLVIGLGITGAMLTTTATIALLALDFICPPHHDMKNHLFREGQCEGGKLYYDGDVPILSLESDDPLKAGKAHGYLCGDAINRLAARFHLVLHTLAREPRAADLPKTLAQIKKATPKRYLKEIEGLVEGYNTWCKEQPWWKFPKKLSVDDVLLLQLVPDSMHFDTGTHEGRASRLFSSMIAVGCSTVIDNDRKKGMVFARNMDWPSFGIAGGYTIVVNRRYKRRPNTVEVGAPGIMGTITGMNSHGLSLAMLVCPGKTRKVRGMPAVFFNRECLEKCRNVSDVENYVQRTSPLGPYHLNIVDENEAKSIHFYQGSHQKHVIRTKRMNRPLSTLNSRYQPKPRRHMHHSEERQTELDRFFKERNGRPIRETLELPYVNNWETTQRVLMRPGSKKFKVAFDNAFAGRIPLHRVNTKKLFK